jgi:hypothetical protein
MESEVAGSDSTHFTFGKGQDSFEMVFDAESLRAFLCLGHEALQEMDARFAAEEAERARGAANPNTV